MTLEQFLAALRTQPEALDFEDTMAVIADQYDYSPAAFRNGDVENSAEQNQGSCKLLAFAQLQGLTEQETLACFGRFYRQDVLNHPDGSDHQNIRQFMQHGWSGVSFTQPPLSPR